MRGKNRLNAAAVILIFVLCAIATAAVIIVLSINDRKARNMYLPFYDYHTELSPDIPAVVVGDNVYTLDDAPEYENGMVYLPWYFVKEHLDEYLFWEPVPGCLTVTDGGRVLKFTAGSPNYTVNLFSNAVLDKPVINKGGVAYLPQDMIKMLWDADIIYNPILDISQPNLIILEKYYNDTDKVYGEITAESARLRYVPGPREPIHKALSAGSPVVIFGGPIAIDREEYIKIRAYDGAVGYVLAEEITELRTEYARIKPLDTYKPDIAGKGSITMAWHVFGSVEASSASEQLIMEKGLDVVSPTWFTLNPDGSSVSLGNAEYSRWAHSQGMEVWGLITDGFDTEISRSVLTSYENRERVIRSLLDYASMYEMDGVNIDFEAVREEWSGHYIQFLRELYPLMKERGLVLSVDMYAPSEWNRYYSRAKAAETSDYIIIMGYDEYWSTSPEAGPNASIGFVNNAVTNTLIEVPTDKTILGVPFFVRVWREGPDGTATSRALSMSRAKSEFDAQGAEFTWDESMGCYYAEYTLQEDGGNARYRVWLEDGRSMELKLNTAVKNGLAGVSGWRKGLESPDIWDLISFYYGT